MYNKTGRGKKVNKKTLPAAGHARNGKVYANDAETQERDQINLARAADQGDAKVNIVMQCDNVSGYARIDKNTARPDGAVENQRGGGQTSHFFITIEFPADFCARVYQQWKAGQ